MIIRTVDFFTDGSCSNKTEMGGWACVCIEDGQILEERCGFEAYTTNNRMELSAFLTALNLVDQIQTGHTQVNIYVDSSYICNCFNDGWYKTWMNNGWRTADRQQVKNQDLLMPIVAAYIKLKNKFELNIVKVEAHQDKKKKELSYQETWNKYVDLLAVKKRKELEAK